MHQKHLGLEAAVPRRPEPAEAAPQAREALLQLQRRAGNYAVQRLLQRELAIRPSDLDPLVGAGGQLKVGLGRSSFGALRSALARYRVATDPDTKRDLLHDLERRCRNWLNDHRGGNSQLDKRRRALVERLLDEVSQEQVGAARVEAQDIYLENVRLAGEREGASADPRKKYALEALSGQGKMAADYLDPAAEKYAEASGLTRAEVAAIQNFTAQDYKYINPATAASKSWLDAQRSTEPRLAKFTDKQLIEEGTLHTGVALQGLAKIKPYTQDVYRGASYTPAEFSAKIAVGKTFGYTSLSSASKSRDVAEEFAFNTAKEGGKAIAVLSVLTNTGGRDISQLSLVSREQEVALLPGSQFAVKSITKMQPPAKYADAKADDKGVPPSEWYMVRLAPSGT